MYFDKAKWLQFHKDIDSVCVRAKFNLKNHKRVILRIIGLGFYKFWINEKLGTEYLYNQLFSNYNQRDLSNVLYPMEDNMSNRIYYSEFDITQQAKNGENILAVMVGNGWYRKADRYCEGDFSYSDSLNLIFEVEADGEIVAVSDDNVAYKESHICSSTLYNGEVQDFSKSLGSWKKLLYSESGWDKAKIVERPYIPLYKNECGSDKITHRYCPKVIMSNSEYTILDCGKNLTGFLEFVASEKQDKILLEYAEGYENGDIVSIYKDLQDFGQQQVEEYLNVPKGQHCVTQFTWYGFRYVKVYGKIKNPRVCHVHTGFERRTSFTSSNEVLNWYYEASLRSLESNMHMGVPMDCPHREKYGYTGDGQVACESVMLNYDARTFYKKWIGDIADSQDKVSGYVQHTAPYMGGGGGVAWGIAIILMPWLYYQEYGEVEELRLYEPNMFKYLKFLQKNAKNGLVQRPEKWKGLWLGDWSYPSQNEMLPIEFVSTYYFIKGLMIYKKVCNILECEYCSGFETSLNESKKAFVDSYYDEKSGDFLSGRAGANAFALDLGLGDARTFENLCKKYEKAGCFDTGIYGTKILLDVLNRNKKNELIYQLLSSTKYPSFGWWKEQGATSLWEDWSGNFFSCDEKVKSSQNHAMYAASQKYLFESLLGITYKNGKFVVSPKPIKSLAEIAGKVQIDRNDYVYVKIKNSPQKTSVEIRVGKNSKVVLQIADKEIVVKNRRKTWDFQCFEKKEVLCNVAS